MRRRRWDSRNSSDIPSPTAATVIPATPLLVRDRATPASPPHTQASWCRVYEAGEGGRPDVLADLLLHGRVKGQLGQDLAERGDQGHRKRRQQPEEHRAKGRHQGGGTEHAEGD